MTAAAVPSTLVKCLYLFFDLPAVEEDSPSEKPSDFNAFERRTLLQKVFVQLLVKLCSYPYPAEELARMDDLTLLFSAITSPCPTHNIVWRKNAAEILTTISRHGLTDAVVSYIHCKYIGVQFNWWNYFLEKLISLSIYFSQRLYGFVCG